LYIPLIYQKQREKNRWVRK